ncbi:hypothetical protein D3C87_2199680 [compost metagenome]
MRFDVVALVVEGSDNQILENGFVVGRRVVQHALDHLGLFERRRRRVRLTRQRSDEQD